MADVSTTHWDGTGGHCDNDMPRNTLSNNQVKVEAADSDLTNAQASKRIKGKFVKYKQAEPRLGMLTVVQVEEAVEASIQMEEEAELEQGTDGSKVHVHIILTVTRKGLPLDGTFKIKHLQPTTPPTNRKKRTSGGDNQVRTPDMSVVKLERELSPLSSMSEDDLATASPLPYEVDDETQTLISGALADGDFVEDFSDEGTVEYDISDVESLIEEGSCSPKGNPTKRISIRLPRLNISERSTVKLTAGMTGLKQSKQHIIVNQSDGDVYACADCGMQFEEEVDLTQHTPTCYGCPAEEKAPDSTDKKSDKKEKRPYKCSNCGLNFRRYYNLARHQKEYGGDEVLKCRYCSKTFSQRCKRKQHLRAHRTTDKFRCNVCDKLFGTPKYLRRHVARKHKPKDVKLFVCEVCPYTTTEKVSFVSHQNKHAGLKPYKCQTCGSAYHSCGGLYSHQKWAHKTGNGETCQHCGKVCRNKTSLAKHILIHNKRHWCNICSFVGATATILQRHIRFVHLCERKEKTIPCSLCPYVTNSNERLANHMRTHLAGTERKQSMCDQCGSKFANPSSLSRHKLQHKEAQKHVCSVCGKSFTQKCTLTRHLDAHQGIKRYRCDVCGMNFSQSFPLTKHLRKNHPEFFSSLVTTGKYKGRQARWVTEGEELSGETDVQQHPVESLVNPPIGQ